MSIVDSKGAKAQIARIGKLFTGLERAHGEFREKSDLRKSDNKVQGSAKTVDGPITAKDWAAHLAGEYGVGAVPVTDEATCTFAAIDFDVYDEFTVKHFVNDAKRSGFPLVWCKSKSGGAHLYMFFAKPIQASVVRQKLGDLARTLGYPKIEIFPKQESLDIEAGQIGNWINLPYFEADNYTGRYAFNDEGNPIEDLAGFLDYAESKLVNPEDFIATKVESQEIPFSDAPICIQQLAHAGISDGERNKVLFQFAIYAKKKYPDDWEEKVLEWNEEYFSPGLPFKEIQSTIFKSLKDKDDYGYLCKEPVCAEVCNKPLCQTREFGVPGGSCIPVDAVLIPSDVTPISESCSAVFPRMAEVFTDLYTVGGTVMALKGDGLAVVSKHDLRLRVEKLGGPTVSLVEGKNGTPKPRYSRLKICDAETMLCETEVIESEFRNVSLVSRAPVLTREGILGNGYHTEAGGLLIMTDREVPVMTFEDGLKILEYVIREYSFKSDADKTRMLAAIITPALRRGQFVNGAIPMPIYRADAPHAGKSKMGKSVARMYNGKEEVISQAEGNAKIEDLYAGCVIRGAEFIRFDNIRGDFNSPTIEMALTADRNEVITLKSSYTPATPCNVGGICHSLTSNGLRISEDMAVRSMIVDMLAQRGKQFHQYEEGSLERYVGAHWPELLGGVYAVLRPWIDAGCPRDPNSYEHEEWAGAMLWIMRSIGRENLFDGLAEKKETCTDPMSQWLNTVGNMADLERDYSATALLDMWRDMPLGKDNATLEDQAKVLGGYFGRQYRQKDFIELDDNRFLLRINGGKNAHGRIDRRYRFSSWQVENADASMDEMWKTPPTTREINEYRRRLAA